MCHPICFGEDQLYEQKSPNTYLYMKFQVCHFFTAGDQRDVFMLQPFTSKSFAIRPLADVIADLKYLLYLYPNIPKEQAFGKYYTPIGEHPTNNGYVKPHLITHVPG